MFFNNHSWKSNHEINIYNKTFHILVMALALSDDENITVEQEIAFNSYVSSKTNIQHIIESKLKEFLSLENEKEILTVITPSVLIFERDGSYALVCNYVPEPENGIVVCLSPEVMVITEDEYV